MSVLISGTWVEYLLWIGYAAKQSALWTVGPHGNLHIFGFIHCRPVRAWPVQQSVKFVKGQIVLVSVWSSRESFRVLSSEGGSNQRVIVLLPMIFHLCQCVLEKNLLGKFLSFCHIVTWNPILTHLVRVPPLAPHLPCADRIRPGNSHESTFDLDLQGLGQLFLS